MSTFPLSKAIQVLFFLFLVFAGLYFARAFLIPIAFAGLLSMLFLPLSRKMENKGMKRALATLLCILILLAAVAAIVSLLAWQVNDLAGDAEQMEQRVTQMINQFKQSINKNFGISPKRQEEILEQQASGAGGGSSIVSGFFGSIMGFLVDALLVLVYIFLFMYFRRHLKTFILKLIPQADKNNAQQIIHDTQQVAQQYLSGLGMMIVGLWIMYGIGFSIVGVKNAIFFAILCGLLEIVPFVGNLTGNALTVLMAISQGGGFNMVLGIIITYAIVQFFQTYILEPLVVGAEVNINPLFTIIIIVLGEMVWGIPGMILAIPLLGIVKIICDHIESLKPYGYLIGGEPKKKKSSGIVDKIKGWFGKK
ncbi:MAG TPA: AI-2E family transporter [Chitinophagaceae bacterium]